MQILDKRRHGRIAAVLLFKLKRQTFAQVAGQHPARLEALHYAQNLFDQLERCAEKLGESVEIAAQIAGFVGHVDQMLTD